MSSPRLFANQMDPALVLFLLELRLSTCLSEAKYTAWLKANKDRLAFEFIKSDEFEPDEKQVECTFGIWARRRFLEQRDSQVSA